MVSVSRHTQWLPWLLLLLFSAGCSSVPYTGSNSSALVSVTISAQLPANIMESATSVELTLLQSNTEPSELHTRAVDGEKIAFSLKWPVGPIAYRLAVLDTLGEMLVAVQRTNMVTGAGLQDFICFDAGVAASLTGYLEVHHPWNQRPTDGLGTVSARSSMEEPVLLDASTECSRSDEQIVRYSDRSQTIADLHRAGYIIQDELPCLRAFLVSPSERREIMTSLSGGGFVWEENVSATASTLGYPWSGSPFSANENIRPVVDTLRSLYPTPLNPRSVLPDDPLFHGTRFLPDRSQRSYMELQMLPLAWQIETGCSDVRIAVLDTGIDYSNPDLVGRVNVHEGIGFVRGPEQFLDFNGHGSHVAGVIGAEANNGQGTAGVMWDVSLVPVQVLDEHARGSAWQIAQGILYAAGCLDTHPIDPVDIIHMSLILDRPSALVRDAVARAASSGVLMVAAVGNDGGPIRAPAMYDEVIAVGALEVCSVNGPRPAAFSNYAVNGGTVDFVAPAINIDAPYLYHRFPREPSYALMTGTSMAAPFVTGALGLLLSAGHDPMEAVSRLKRTASPLPQTPWQLSGGETGSEGPVGYYAEHQVGYGLPNVFWALTDPQEVIVGVWKKLDDGTFQEVQRITVPLESPREVPFHFDDLPEGTYFTVAWIDVDHDGQLSDGDYFGAAGPVRLHEPNANNTLQRLPLHLVVVE